MPETRVCPQCGTELPPDAPEGVCPRCVLIHGIETQPPSDSASAAGSASPAAQSYHGSFTAPTIEQLAPHFPQLEIIELLGQGGMGAVYKARQPGLDRLVAVKILPPDAARDPAFAERFAREGRALAKINHPNIVAVYDSGEHEGLYYFIMEYVDGLNLRELIRSGLCKPEEALRIVPLICEALQFAHDEGIVHRDIKPENILLDKRGRLKIADFGLARLLGHTRTDYTLTGPWQVMGTPNYMAPEQMDDPLKVDHRADIYSLGVVFYEMLTGELPRGRFAPPSQKVQVDVRLDEVVLRALEQEPQRRYQQASEVKTDVESISRSPQAGSVGQVFADHQSRVQDSANARIVGPGSAAPPAEAVIARGRDIVQGPADVMMLAAGAALLTAMGVTHWLWSKWNAGLLENTKWTLVGMSVMQAVYGLFMVAAALLMRSLRVRIIALLCVVIVGLFVPAVAALNIVMEFSRIPQWPVVIPTWLGVPVAVWATIVLFRRDVRAAFKEQKSLARILSNTVPPERRVKAPADCLLLAAGIAFVTACGVAAWLGVTASRGHDLTTPLVRHNLTAASGTLATYSLFIGVAGLMLRRLRVRLFVLLVAVVVGLFLPAAVALNVVMEFRQTHEWLAAVPLWLGMPVALWVVVTLFRDDVRRAFGAARATSGKFLDWLFMGAGAGAGAVAGVWSVFGGLALLFGLAAFFKWSSGERAVAPSANQSANRAVAKTGEQWFGNKGDEHVMFWGPDSPTVSDGLASHLGLDATQRAAMDQAFQKFFREFKALEEQNTRHETDANGHQVTTIAPLLSAVPPLEQRFWSELDSALDGRQLTLGRKTVGLQLGMFETGNYGYRIEIWRVGQINPWYHWTESYPGRANVSQNMSSSAPELPEKLRRFWKEPETYDATSLQGTWVAVAGERNGGQPLSANETGGVMVSFDRDHMRVTMQGRNDEGTLKLDVAQRPKRIAVTRVEGPNRFGIMDGIYELDGDHLRLCMGEPEDRPAEFKTRAGSRLINLDLVRQTAVGPIAFEAVTGQLVQTGILVIDRLGKSDVTFPRPFAGSPTFIFPREQFTGPGRFTVEQSSPTGFTIDVSDAAFTPDQPVRLGWLATGQPGPPISPDKDTIVWGTPSPKGVQLGVELDPLKLVYRAGEVVKLQLHLRNSGTAAIHTTLPRLEVLEKFGFELSLLDVENQKVPWTWGQGHKPRELWTVSGGTALSLAPSHVYKLPTAELVIGTDTSLPTALAILDVQPGQTYHLRCKLGTYSYAQGEGEPLESGVIAFRVEKP